MQLDRIAIALRPRGGWESIDLGFRMVLRWAVPVWTLWFVLFIPVLTALLMVFRDQPFLVALAIWWLKPVFDRFLLHVFAHSVFGAPPRLADSLAAWRSVLGSRLWPSLLLRPFAWSRSFLAPVAQLEMQHGKAARLRAGVLGRRLGGHVLALAAVCLCFEVVAVVGLSSLLELLQPGGWLVEGEDHSASPFWQPEWWGLHETLLYALAVSLIEPFFVAAGFSLYLSRRVMLEGWDIEIGLRRAITAASVVATARAGLAVLMLGLLFSAELPASPAQSPSEVEASTPIDLEAPFDAEVGGCDVGPPLPDYQPLDTEARRAIVEVLAHADFGGEREVRRWRPRDSDRDVDTPRIAWLEGLGDLMATSMRVLSWLVLAALVIAAIWSIARRWGSGSMRVDREAPPAQLFGLAISPDSLPSDVAAAARAAMQQGQLREALSLLYRGALSHLVHQRGLRIGGGATEGDVMRLARRLLPAATAGYFERLLPAWVDLAYAHRAPEAQRVEHLCNEYAAHFAARGRAMVPAA